MNDDALTDKKKFSDCKIRMVVEWLLIDWAKRIQQANVNLRNASKKNARKKIMQVWNEASLLSKKQINYTHNGVFAIDCLVHKSNK